MTGPTPKPARERRMSRAMLYRSIAAIPGENGWWSSSGHVTFTEIADKLLSKGFTTDEALELLEKAYGAVAGEFGS